MTAELGKLKKHMSKPTGAARRQLRSVNRERTSGERTTEGSRMIDKKSRGAGEAESGGTKQLRKPGQKRDKAENWTLKSVYKERESSSVCWYHNMLEDVAAVLCASVKTRG
jgi:hypothetical protein